MYRALQRCFLDQLARVLALLAANLRIAVLFALLALDFVAGHPQRTVAIEAPIPCIKERDRCEAEQHQADKQHQYLQHHARQRQRTEQRQAYKSR